jgi:hypothetical protein
MRRNRVPTRPRDVQRLCVDIARMALEVISEAPEIQEICYSRLPGPASERVKMYGSNPTYDQAAHNGAVKHQYSEAMKAVRASRTQLRKALFHLHQAIGTADESEDFRDPEGRYSRRILEDNGWEVSHRELLEAREAQKRRAG